MKTIKINSIPSLGVLLFSVLLFTACAQNKKRALGRSCYKCSGNGPTVGRGFEQSRRGETTY